MVGVLMSTAASAQDAASRVSERETTRRCSARSSGCRYYGVFDFMAFKVDRGTVTLTGYAYNGSLRNAAESRQQADVRASMKWPIESSCCRHRRTTIASDGRPSTGSTPTRSSRVMRRVARIRSGARSTTRGDSGVCISHSASMPSTSSCATDTRRCSAWSTTQATGRSPEVRAREVTGVFSVENEIEVAAVIRRVSRASFGQGSASRCSGGSSDAANTRNTSCYRECREQVLVRRRRRVVHDVGHGRQRGRRRPACPRADRAWNAAHAGHDVRGAGAALLRSGAAAAVCVQSRRGDSRVP